MNANEYNKYMEAVDMVCLHCVYDGNDPDAGENYCDNCMVLKSWARIFADNFRDED